MIIYKATNIINGKTYVGQTIRKFNIRINAHLKEARLHKDNMYFHSALRKYGKDAFKWEIICECDNRYVLNILETFYIMINKSHVTENGYNVTWGGDRGCWGYRHTEEHKKYIGMILKGRKYGPISEEQRKHMSESQKGKKHTKETKEKLRLINIGRKHSDETKQKMSEKQKQISYKTHTPESNKKRSETLKGRIIPEETKKKMSESAYSLYNSSNGDEYRKAISQPGDKNGMYKYIWIVENIETGQVEYVKNKTQWCKENNVCIGTMKYAVKDGKTYKNFRITRQEDVAAHQNYPPKEE